MRCPRDWFARCRAKPAEPQQSRTRASVAAAASDSRSSSASLSATSSAGGPVTRRARRSAVGPRTVARSMISAESPVSSPRRSTMLELGESTPRWVASSGQPSMNTCPDRTTRPSLGSAGATSTRDAPVTSTSAAISCPGWPRRAESIFLYQAVGFASERSWRAARSTAAAAVEAGRSRDSVDRAITSHSEVARSSISRAVRRPAAAKGALASIAPVKSSAMRASLGEDAAPVLTPAPPAGREPSAPPRRWQPAYWPRWPGRCRRCRRRCRGRPTSG